MQREQDEIEVGLGLQGAGTVDTAGQARPEGEELRPVYSRRGVSDSRNKLHSPSVCYDLGSMAAGLWSLRDFLPALNLMKGPLLHVL